MNILIAEDNPINRKLLGAMLEAEGHHVFPANDGLEALNVLDHENIEAVISDILMPRMDGYRLCKRVRQNQQLGNIPFIFYTSTYTSSGDEKLALRLGADKFLKKPASYKERFEAIQQAPNQQRTATPGPVRRLNEQPVMKQYSEALVRKLDQKVAELAAAQDRLAALNEDLERRVKERTAQLEIANRELEIFADSVSHDLRAPLRNIDGTTLGVLEDFGDTLTDAAKISLQRVRDSVSHMSALIDGLLQLSRTSQVPMRHEQIDLSALAKTIVADLQTSEPERHVETTIAENLSARGDPALLRAVLENLLNNAWKFTGKKPLARIEFGSLESPPKPLEVMSPAAKNPFLSSAPPLPCDEPGASRATIFFVRDDGAGYEMAYADKLFGPFQRLHSQSEFSGTGIGLATVQRIVHRHGGRIWAEGKPDEGATFFFTLPP